ncbi:hypothetical protein F0562_028504 [Nyssa sinensis]|uniref:Uncharacterized protein n=1 Tax=Nyssa sinensis TaxID=561372 RepID=A0A5J5B1H0_9ASTE|nr:hypothetical protein F0562_028504 [Nyssa sinensis]
MDSETPTYTPSLHNLLCFILLYPQRALHLLTLSSTSMDLSLSANPQTLSLISCAPFSSTSSSLLSPPRFRSLRREFLGCGHNLRPPGLRSRRKCKKLGFHIQSPRFLFRASLDSQATIVVVAVVTVSALTVVYLNYSKRKQNVKKMSGLSILALPERIRGIMNWVIMHDIFGTKDIERKTSVGGNKDSMQQMGEFSHASEDKAVQLVMKEPALMHEETLITKTLECHGSEIIAPPETEFGSDLHKLMVKEKLTVASVPMDSALAEVNEHKKANTEPGEEYDTISYSRCLQRICPRRHLHIL